MNLEEMTSVCQAFAQDWGQTVPSGYIRLLLNTGNVEFVKLTEILRARKQITVTNGIGSLSPTPDSVNLIGRIYRVEDANNGNKGLDRKTEAELDILPGPHWRSIVDGSIKNWLRGLPPEDDTKTAEGHIQTYPAVVSGLLKIFYVKRPVKLINPDDESDIPEEYHMALVWYAVTMLLAPKANDPAVAGILEFAKSRWDADVELAKAA